MSEEPVKLRLFDGFVGVGYYLRDVRPRLLLVFDKRKLIYDAWNKAIKWWPEDDIRIIFKEYSDSYLVILYSKPAISDTNIAFVKSLPLSPNYKKFLTEFEGVLNLGLALRHKADSEDMELEIFNYKKRISRVKLVRNDNIAGDTGLDADEELILATSKKFFEIPR